MTATVIRQLLIQRNLGTAAVGSWQVFVSFLPETPDKAICVYDTAGRFDGRLQATGERIEHPGFQILIRGTEYLETLQKAKAIEDALDGVRGSFIALPGASSYSLSNVSRSGPLIPVGVEEVGSKRRRLFTINATVTMKKVS